MKRNLSLFAIVFLFLTAAKPAYSSHILGGELTFKAINDSVFNFRLTLYRDPTGASMGNAKTLRDKHGSVNESFVVALDSMVTKKVSCTENIEVYYYSADKVINDTYTEHIVYWSDCCRRGSIDNIFGSGGFYLSAVLHPSIFNRAWKYRSTPQFYAPANPILYTPFVSQLDLSSYSINGDSLFIELIKAQEGSNDTGVDLSYSFQTNENFPFGINVLTTFNANTGILEVTDPLIGEFVVAAKASMYHQGVLVSSTVRDLMFFSKPYSPVYANFPTTEVKNVKSGTGGYTKQGNQHYFTVYEGETVEFDFEAKNSTTFPFFNPPIVSTLYGNNCINNKCATFAGILVDTLLVNAHFSFKLPASFVTSQGQSKTAKFMIKTKGIDHCGIEYFGNEYININVLNTTVFSAPDTLTICEGDSTIIKITGDVSNLSWQPNVGVQNPTSDSTWVFPQSSTLYTIYNLNDSSLTQVFVDVLPPAKVVPTVTANQVSVPANPDFSKVDWYYYNVLIDENTLVTDAISNGAYWPTISGQGCGYEGDTTLKSLVDFASAVRVNQGVKSIENYIYKTEFTFTPQHANTTLKYMYFTFPIDKIDTLNTWSYHIYAGSNPIEIAVGSLIPANSQLKTGSLNLGLKLNQTYRVVIKSTNTAATQFWPLYSPTQFPYLDQHSLVSFGSAQAYTLNGATLNKMPFVDLNVHFPGIGIDENEQPSFVAFPNPMQDVLHINAPQSGTLTMMDASGKVVMKKHISVGEVTLETNFLRKGFYVLQLYTLQGIFIQKLTK